MLIAWGVVGASLVAWLFLIIGRGGFWLPQPQLDPITSSLDTQGQDPVVVAIVPARNEEAVLDRKSVV